MNSKGERIGRILDIESDKTKLSSAVIGDKVAISVDDAVYGRNIIEGEILYTDISMPDVMKFDDVAEELTSDYKEALSEIRKIKGI
jgi:translation initiation factor 5B